MSAWSISNKIKPEGISKSDFLAQISAESDKQIAESIFNQFNTNNKGDSADKLDQKEQMRLISFMKKMAGGVGDTNVSDQDFSNGSSLLRSVGLADISNDNLMTFNTAFNALTSNGTKVSFGAEGSVTVNGETYHYDNNMNLSYKTTVGNSDNDVTTQGARKKYDLVHLSDSWRVKRDVGNAIANDKDGYGEIKNKKTATEVLNAILEKKGITISEDTKENFLKTFIKYNPSIFNRETGEVWLNADWTKLDFPEITRDSSAEAITATVAQAGEIDDVYKVTLDGFYKASADKSSVVNGITLSALQKAEAGEGTELNSAGKNRRFCGARYVLDQVLKTKMDGVLSEENKAKLLAEIIKRNPEVFDEQGWLKDGVTDDQIKNVNVPSLSWIKSKYGIKANGDGNFIKQQGNRTIRGDNGYYAVKEGLLWTYHKPDGTPMSGNDFAKKCPTIFSRCKALKGANGYIATKDGAKWTYYDPSGRKIDEATFKAECPNLYNLTKSDKTL